ncbi:Alpha/Beta hydrolase protein, partial [Lipomyces kononenkoae]
MLAQMTIESGGEFVPGPFYTPIARNGMITVHSIGGCVMSVDGTSGVTNHKGQVFKYSDGKSKSDVHTGLYVVDGAVIPTALGVNPFLTITALAERTVELAAKDRGWVISPRRITQAIDFKSPAYAPPRPLRQVVRNRPGIIPSQGGIAFSEVMKGYFGTDLLSDDYHTAESQGRASSSTMEVFLTIIAYDLRALVELDDHSADIVGTVSCRALSADPLLVCQGSRFRLFCRDISHVSTENLAYDLNLLATDGSKYRLEGHKVVDTTAMLNPVLVWKATTTLYVTVSASEDKGNIKAGTVLGRGILHLGMSDFIKELTRFAAWANLPENSNLPPGLARIRQQLASFNITAQFVLYFARHVAEHFLPPMLQYPGSNKDMTYATTSTMHSQWYVTTRDGGRIRMHRWNAGRKGPVLLVPGASVTYEIFGTNLIPTNFVTYLTDRGYDVFSLDHRLSPTIRASMGQIPMESVRFDVEAAVSETRLCTGCTNITAVVHCAGSIATFIGLLDGTISGVGHVVASQVAMHPIAGSVNRVKAHKNLAPIVKRVLGVDYIDVKSTPRSLKDIAIDQFLRLYPVGPFSEVCGSTVCHRCSLLFGLLWRHDNLNDALHSNLDKLIGGVNMTTLIQLANMTLKELLLDAKGENVYVTPENARKRLNFPITFIHGNKNQTYDIKSTDADYNFLRNVNGPDKYRRRVFENYGHLDTWFGLQAYKDIYPWVVDDIEYWADKKKIGYL